MPRKKAAEAEKLNYEKGLVSLFDEYRVRLTLITPALGSAPDNKEIYSNYIAKKMAEYEIPDWEELEEEELSTLPLVEKKITVFHRDEKGLFLYNYALRGFFKESGKALKDIIDIKQIANKVDNYLFVEPRRLYLMRDGKHITEPDEVFERPMRIQTPMGPRNVLAASELVKEGAYIEARILALKGSPFEWDKLKLILDYGRYKGLNVWRSGGWGSFEWKLLR